MEAKKKLVVKGNELRFCYYVNVDSSSYLSIFNLNFSIFQSNLFFYTAVKFGQQKGPTLLKKYICDSVNISHSSVLSSQPCDVESDTKVNKSTCSNMVYGELGVTPLVLHLYYTTEWLCFGLEYIRAAVH